MDKKTQRTLNVISIIFIVFGIITVVLSLLMVFGAAYNLYLVGFWGGFVTAFLALFEMVYSVIIVTIGFFALFRKRLNFCYKMGVLIAVFSIIKIVMAFSQIFMGHGIDYAFITNAVLSILIPVLFVCSISAVQKKQEALSAQGSETPEAEDEINKDKQ